MKYIVRKVQDNGETSDVLDTPDLPSMIVALQQIVSGEAAAAEKATDAGAGAGDAEQANTAAAAGQATDGAGANGTDAVAAAQQ